MKSIFLFVVSVAISFAVAYIFVKPQIESPFLTDKKDAINEATSFFSLEQAPSTSLRGKLAKIVGDVKIQTRLATEPASLSSETEIQQGEALVTGESGSVAVEFQNGAEVGVSAESNIDFVQTLPDHIVVVQREGTAQYQSAKNAFMSVRSMHLLADIEPESDVTVEKDAELLTFTVKKGRVDVAFNSLENVTSTTSIHQGDTYVFNDDTREGEVE